MKMLCCRLRFNQQNRDSAPFLFKAPLLQRVTENLVIAKIPTLLHKLTSEAKINCQSKQGMEVFCCCSGLMHLFAKRSETRVSGPSDACSVQGNAKKQLMLGSVHTNKTKIKAAL